MASKKYSFLTGILCLLASYGFSQTGYDVMDSSVIKSRNMPQYTGFKQGVESFPAKPRNQLEVGFKLGITNIAGDVASKIAFPSGGIHIRKAFGYVFSARLEYAYHQTAGQNWMKSTGYWPNVDNPWTYLGYQGTPVFYNYKTRIQDLSLEGIFSLNNIRFHKSKTGVNFYGLAGLGGMIYRTRVNALGSDNQRYNFASVANGTYKTRKDIKDAIKNLSNHDDSYETLGERQAGRRPILFGETFRPVAHVGAGIAWKLSNRANLALEDRFTVTKDDLLDAQQWAEQKDLTRDFDAINYLTLGINFNLGKKSVEPLWWVNPLDYAYQELRKPKYMILPKPVLPDSDGDGVTDQFDQEQTPQGCPVDTHGVSLDTDGDGVPDCRDKEKVTPTYCQPVDADGVGKCPCPNDSCFPKGVGTECAQILGSLPSITFTSNSSVSLTNDAKALLASVAARLRQSPTCKVVVTSYCASSKAEQQRSWDRVNAVINYMVDKEGISADRFFWNYGQEGGDCNTVDLRAAGENEQGQTTVPAPHPNLSRGK